MSDELRPEIEPLVSSLFEYVEVQSVNFKVDGLNGHPFTIGTAHVVEASDHHGGMLTQSVAEKIPCAARGCGRPYSAHTSDKVLFLKLKRDMTQVEAHKVLASEELKRLMSVHRIDGFCFIETEEKFRIKEAIQK